MRFMLLMKSDEAAEAGVLPDAGIIAAMGGFNDEMVRAGVLLAAEGLHPSAKGARLRRSAGRLSVTDGPFTEAKELIAGFWLIQVKSREEAIEWVRRVPSGDEESEIEIRQVFEADDFGDAMTPEVREQEAALRARASETS